MHVISVYNIYYCIITKCNYVVTADKRIQLGPRTSWRDFEFVLLWIHFYTTDRWFAGRKDRGREIDRLRSLQHRDPNDLHPPGCQIFGLSSHCAQSHRGSVRGMYMYKCTRDSICSLNINSNSETYTLLCLGSCISWHTCSMVEMGATRGTHATGIVCFFRQFCGHGHRIPVVWLVSRKIRLAIYVLRTRYIC